MIHNHPIANGYSGFFPLTYQALKKRLPGVPVSDTLRFLRDSGFGYLVLQMPELGLPARKTWERWAAQHHLAIHPIDVKFTVVDLHF